MVNGVVYLDFSKPSTVSVGSTHPSHPSRKRPSSTVTSAAPSELDIPTNPKVCFIQATGRVKPQASVPAAPTSKREAAQVNRVRFAAMPDDDLQMSSQPEPEEISVEPPPNRSSKSSVNPSVWDRINSLDAISITQVDSSSPKRAVVTDDVVTLPPLEPGVANILEKYKHVLDTN